MRILCFVVLCNILPVIIAQLELINENLGDFHFHAKAGTLPQKYYPLSQQDQKASEKAADVVDFIQLVPNIDPFKMASLEPLGIDLPFLWLSGKIYMKNFVMAGIKQLIVQGVELRMKNIRTDLNVSLPLIYVEGDFNLQGHLSFLPVLFSCHVSANLMDLNVVVSSGSKVIQAPPVGEVLQVDSAEVKLDIRNVQLNLTNVVVGGSHEDVGFTVTQLFSGRSSHDNMFDSLLKSVLKMVNKELLTVSTEIFKSYLLSDY